MRLISLRKFRDSIAQIEEPVEVARRDPSGTIQIIGVWTPGIADLSSPRDGLIRTVAATIATDERTEEIPIRFARPIGDEDLTKPHAVRFNSQPFTGPIPKKR